MPLLPTTPFLLLAAACYIRSSEKFYNWLINNKYLGKYIKHYIEGTGIPLKGKIFSITILWFTILISAIFVIHIIWVKILLLVIAIGVTIHILKHPTLSIEKVD